MGQAIQVRGLGKQYRLGAKRARYETLRDRIAEMATAPFRRLKALAGGHSTIVSDETIWAVRDLDLAVGDGEVVGVIGRNGAGKTTLLKLLSRITEPTEGEATIHGRVASLLEVGTGFHPELTGRENVYLNGAILGMRRREVDAKFDRIVEFSEIERFVDTQVKHYSSGMYLRLAFAVAAHLDPEILLVDEVLAVGDAQFQRRCIGAMGDVAKSGRTVLFVSHNMDAVQRLCQRCVWIDQGRVRFDGEPHETIHRYLSEFAGSTSPTFDETPDAELEHQLLRARVGVVGDRESSVVPLGAAFEVSMNWRHRSEPVGAQYFVRVIDDRGRVVFATHSATGTEETPTRAGESSLKATFDPNMLKPGDYSISLGLFRKPQAVLADYDGCLSFTVTDRHVPGLHAGRQAIVAVSARWEALGTTDAVD